jgi:hypothetical protein
MPSTDPIAFVDELDPDVIRERLDDLDRQSRALRVLLRAALARRRYGSHDQALEREGAGDAE